MNPLFQRVACAFGLLLALLAPSAHALSGLRLYCDQEGAEVFISAKRLGTCPLKEVFKPGSYTLEIRKNLSDQSYYYHSGLMTLKDGDNRVDVTLERIYPEAYWYGKAVSTKYITDWDEYLRRYPSGSHSNEVHQILENYFYTTASNGASQSAWQEYLRRYASGYRSDAARQEVAGLQKAENYRLARAEQERQAAITRAKQERAEAIRSGKLIIDCDVCPELLVIPAGNFQMGSNDGRADETPVNSVNIKRFALGKFEVTQGQWQAVMGSNPSRFSSCGPNCPVENVSWNDIQRYIQKLNAKSGQQYRLPSKAEWEYAARAGSSTKYSWGDSVGKNNANCDGCGSQWDNKTTAPVGQFPANAFGLHDMHGNVWECVQDYWHTSYSGAPTDGSAWESGGAQNIRLLRGGSWNSVAAHLRSAYRVISTPDDRSNFIGFRLARTLFTP